MTAAALLAKIDAQCSDATRAIKRAAREPQSEIWDSIIEVAMEHHATLRALRVAVEALEDSRQRHDSGLPSANVTFALAKIARLLEVK